MRRGVPIFSDAARQLAERGPAWRDEPEYEDCDDEPNCTHCGGEGLCMDGSDPLGDCPDDPHRCHACGGSGKGKDQVVW